MLKKGFLTNLQHYDLLDISVYHFNSLQVYNRHVEDVHEEI